MLRSPRLNPTTAARAFAGLLLATALSALACAGAHEEPPAPPPPPVDPSAFSGPARTPAPQVDLGEDLDGGTHWFDASPASEAPDAADAASNAVDARAPSAAKKKH